jgi:hypothetical protein
MRNKITYYYNPVVKSNDEGRYSVDYYCSDGKHSRWAGCHNSDSPIESLSFVMRLIEKLNCPRPLFGHNGRIAQWLWWKKEIRRN